MYTCALADLNLATSPWNNNRYAFTGGNPITGIELDGHRPIGQCDGPCSINNPGQQVNPITGQVTGSQWTPDEDKPTVSDTIRDRNDNDRQNGSCFVAICVPEPGDVAGEAGTALPTALGWFGQRVSDAGRMLAQGNPEAAKLLALLRHSKFWRELGRVGRTAIIRGMARSVPLVGVAISYGDYRQDGDTQVTALMKATVNNTVAGITTTGFTVGGSFVGGPIGGFVGLGAGAAVGGLVTGPMVTEIASPVIEPVGDTLQHGLDFYNDFANPATLIGRLWD